MNIEIFFIIICYVLIGFLLVIFNLRTNFHWVIKATMIILVTLFYVLTYKSFKNLNDPSGRSVLNVHKDSY